MIDMSVRIDVVVSGGLGCSGTELISFGATVEGGEIDILGRYLE